MNGRPFTKEEDKLILDNPQWGYHRLATLMGRAYQSVRDHREKLFNYEPPRIRPPSERLCARGRA